MHLITADHNIEQMFLFFFLMPHAACGILILQPGIKPVVPPALTAGNVNQQTAREARTNA